MIAAEYISHYSLPCSVLEMSFFERLLSTYYMWETLQFRNHILVGRAEKIWGKHFPGESKTTILELEKNASLALSFGHPHLTDGWKPTMPNYVQIGKYSIERLNCHQGCDCFRTLQE